MRIPDRKQLRQEYLRRRTAAAAKSIGGHLLFVCGFVFTLLCATATVILILAAIICTVFAPEYWLSCAVGALVLAISTAAGGHSVWEMDQFVDRARQEADIPYVPPVAPNTLPAEEVLVRGAQKPSEEILLLRAAAGIKEAPVEELLRATVGEE